MTAIKTHVTLKFPSFYTMWTYIRTSRLHFYEPDYGACTLHGEYTRDEIDMAVKKYGAREIPSTCVQAQVNQ